ncbi:erythropoietin receptor [Lampris incognitus]|uniref:erythropoietin receptor n=1 Tax=Lampris incognitus TaxID=2546036 RepID=UPI0024B523B0|nr:erythropoietin receptor [Lampris incognitus]
MTCDHLNRVLVICMLLCAQAAVTVPGAEDFQKKVSLVLHEESENPKCFAEGKTDLTCFWEEDEERAGSVDQYTFTYTYQNENSSRCPVSVLTTVGGKRLYVCQLNQTQLFVQMDIQVHRDSLLIHSRSLLIELAFLLDPPTNVTVKSTDQQGQLKVTWVPPPLKYMIDSMMYEVSYATADSNVGLVEVVHARSELMLRGLQPGTQYNVRVRVKLDGLSYNGYWSTWTDPVSLNTLPADVDPLIVSLTLSSLIFALLSLAMLLSHRRFLTEKIWPAIPNPESKFPGLFTVYGGDFQEWLGQTNGGLWSSPTIFCTEECPSALEVLSEVSLSPLPPFPVLLPKAPRAFAMGVEEEKKDDGRKIEDKTLRRVDSALLDRWREMPHDHWLMDQLRALNQHPVPCSQSSLLESQDAYVTLSGNNHGGDEHLDDILEETLPLEILFASRGKLSSESHSDLGSLQQSSGSGRLSSQSSFEYPNHTWPPKGPGYTYMAVADSGVSMDYSPMSSSRIEDIGKVVIYANEYKNEIPAHRRPLLTRQHHVDYGC